MKQNITYVNGMPIEMPKKINDKEKAINDAMAALDFAIKIYKEPKKILRPKSDHGFREDFLFLFNEASRNISLFEKCDRIFSHLITEETMGSEMVNWYIELSEKIKQDKSALSMKIADFFILLGTGKIDSATALFEHFPILYFNEKEQATPDLYKVFGISNEDKWAKLYQLFGLEIGITRRVTAVLRELADKGVMAVLEDDNNGVPEEKKDCLIQLIDSGKIGVRSKNHKKIVSIVNDSTTPILSGNLLAVFDGNGGFSQSKAAELAHRRKSEFNRVSFSKGILTGTMPSEKTYADILDYMYKHNIPLVDQVFNHFIREFSLGIFKLPAEYKVLMDGRPAVREEDIEQYQNMTITGRNNGNSRVPYDEFPEFKKWKHDKYKRPTSIR